ncbi:hypothetical protein BGX26_006037 [Mortierella sp. AD094]|nr:hypothetical protein BGX26_006037 [Mortierella sp. AD094]
MSVLSHSTKLIATNNDGNLGLSTFQKVIYQLGENFSRSRFDRSFDQQQGNVAPDSYIAILKEGRTADSFQLKFNNIAKRRNACGGREPSIHQKNSIITGFTAAVGSASPKEIMASDVLGLRELSSV